MSRSGRGEFEIIDQLRQRCRTSSNVQLGIGDDCAILELPPGEVLLTTTDMLVEGVHFRRDWIGMLSLGHKSAAVNLSDLAAMGATPQALFLAIALPNEITDTEIDQFLEGFLDVCHANKAVLAGGDTCSSLNGLSISVTALGSARPAQVVRRTGARPGEGIYVTGSLGDSALALHCLLEGRALSSRLLQRHFEPTARIDIGAALAEAGLPSAMIDISDGLLADLMHIMDASQVGARIEVDQIPLSTDFHSVSRNEPSVFDLALSGGEDYELLFTMETGKERTLNALVEGFDLTVTRIGTVLENLGEIELFQCGRPYPAPRQTGYKHFSDATE